jgi:hypothetical protein
VVCGNDEEATDRSRPVTGKLENITPHLSNLRGTLAEIAQLDGEIKGDRNGYS